MYSPSVSAQGFEPGPGEGSSEASSGLSWAKDALVRTVPKMLLAYYHGNLSRAWGPDAAGAASPYAYVGMGSHFFDVHWEEMGFCAVNVSLNISQQKQSGNKRGRDDAGETDGCQGVREQQQPCSGSLRSTADITTGHA